MLGFSKNKKLSFLAAGLLRTQEEWPTHHELQHRWVPIARAVMDGRYPKAPVVESPVGRNKHALATCYRCGGVGHLSWQCKLSAQTCGRCQEDHRTDLHKRGDAR